MQCNSRDSKSIVVFPPSTRSCQFLDLSRNQLNGIPERYAAQLSRIADVKLENNPLICDWCHMGPLIMKAKKVRGSARKRPTCGVRPSNTKR